MKIEYVLNYLTDNFFTKIICYFIQIIYHLYLTNKCKFHKILFHLGNLIFRQIIFYLIPILVENWIFLKLFDSQFFHKNNLELYSFYHLHLANKCEFNKIHFHLGNLIFQQIIFLVNSNFEWKLDILKIIWQPFFFTKIICHFIYIIYHLYFTNKCEFHKILFHLGNLIFQQIIF